MAFQHVTPSDQLSLIAPALMLHTTQAHFCRVVHLPSGLRLTGKHCKKVTASTLMAPHDVAKS